ncbi:MAG: Sulfate adenylyltransferase [Porticoccaceae bacterium UBA1117]|nr:MAG: Sulfate adenylyltransferase [Porticoccaceae bacterium UBA1117]
MLIKPHGSNALNSLFVEDVNDRNQAIEDASKLPCLNINSAAAANLVMLGAGYFNPLTGFMNLLDAMSVCKSLHTTDGLFWPVPIINVINQKPSFSPGSRIALLDPNVDGHQIMATMDVSSVEEISDEQLRIMSGEIFGTNDSDHPGVATFNALGKYLIAGEVQVLSLSYFQADFPDTFRTAGQIRSEISQRGWQTVVAFQTRNPMHRAHEELCRMAMERLSADGLVVHMLLGKLKSGDIPASVRDECIRVMVDSYFPENSVMVTGYGFDMLYAGPREAILHAIFRQNMGATHLIVGRDHAGVGDYYGAFEAQEIFLQRVPEGALDIEIFSADHTAFSKKLGRVVMMNEVVEHTADDFVLLSGTRVREMLSNGVAPPKEFSRPEVAKVLMDFYQIEDA